VLLCNARLSNSALALPSWIPNWSLHALAFEDIAPQGTRYPGTWAPGAGGECTTATVAGGVEFDDSCNGLVVTAFLIGPVVHLGTIYKYRDDPNPNIPGLHVEGHGEGMAEAAATTAFGGDARQPDDAGDVISGNGNWKVATSASEEEWAKFPILFR